MIQRFPLLVFDWDGTLMDSTALIVQSIQLACAELGLAVPDRAAASWVIGMGLAEALRHVAPALDPADTPRLVDAYRRHYLAHDQDLQLFPGALAMLQQLKARGHSLAVATGKSRPGLERVLQHADLRGLFDATRTADQTASKPDPTMLQQLMAELVYPPELTLMVGDTTHDLQMAANAGVAAVACSYGAHPASDLLQLRPLHLVDSVAQLRSFLIDG